MVAQQYDNTWLYTKNLTTRFDADNRLDYGISKDLVADAIREFGIKLYSNNFNLTMLYTSIFRYNSLRSDIPLPKYDGPFSSHLQGIEYVDDKRHICIKRYNTIRSMLISDYINEFTITYPYYLRTKGTIAGIRALITAYGIS